MSNPANTRVVVAMMEHETNTFSPVPTPLARFGRGGFGVPEGPEVYTRFKGTGTGIGGLLDAADDAGWDIVTPIAGNAAPSGKVHADAYNYMSDAICSAVEAGCDAVMLDLHGAMVAETTTDGEGTLLARIRSIAPDIPIGISLDLHANMTDAIVDNCTVLVGYKTYPHLDMYEAGAHAGQLLVRTLAGEINPVMVWGSRPILAQTLRMGHEDEPMGPLLEMARLQESRGLLASSVFGGFPLADIWHAGLSVVTIADANQPAAEEASRRDPGRGMGGTSGVHVRERAACRDHFIGQGDDRMARSSCSTTPTMRPLVEHRTPWLCLPRSWPKNSKTSPCSPSVTRQRCNR